MNIKIEANFTGQEIINYFVEKLKEQNVTAAPENIKILALNSKGQEVEIGADKLNFVFKNN